MATSIAQRFVNVGDKYLVSDYDVAGGYRCCDTIATRDAIALQARKIGMTVYVSATNTRYRLVGGIGNGYWQTDTPYGGTIHNIFTYYVTAPEQQFDDLYAFEQYAAQQLVSGFNTLPEANRVLDTQLTFLKIYLLDGTASFTVDTPESMTYVGDATFVYMDIPQTAAVELDTSTIMCLSKCLKTQYTAVIKALDAYSEVSEANEP